MYSHGANPVAVPISGAQHRILFNCRDRQGRSHVAWLDISLDEPNRILALADRPLLSPGGRGEFDDAGVSIGGLVAFNGCWRLYYLGWNLCISVPFRNSVGVAQGSPFYGFSRCGRAPILDRSDIDPLSLSYPWVLYDGKIWHMWYGSTTEWRENSAMIHVIRHAHSFDGIRWQPDTDPVLSLADVETAHSRPCVLRQRDVWHMWFSRKTETGYSIGYAVSENGRYWQRSDDSGGLTPSGEGWDSDEVSYPCIFDYADRRYMLYCGNGYGRTGFGLAIWDTP